MEIDNQRKQILIILSIIVLFAAAILPVVLNPSTNVFDSIIRVAALTGFVSLFVASILSSFTRQIYKIFSKPFVKIHHLFAIVGLILITIHPLALAISQMNLAVFIPDVSSLENFLILGGRPAIYIIYIVLFAGFARRMIPKYWKILHGSIYIALLLAYIHGVLIGTDFQNPGIFVLFSSMMVLSLIVLVYKRYVVWKRMK
ncbi:MAG: hypothetical protein GF411_03475 [Candidatus Lokiarchaeota archaeon]|nr:hypothetical protein [Candidatus Lokiarchaeota archaeon]